LQFSLHRRRLIGIEEFCHGHPPDQPRVGLTRQDDVELDALLNDKILGIVAIPHQCPLIAFVAIVIARWIVAAHYDAVRFRRQYNGKLADYL
jgi:hypothetical protein